MSVCRTIFFGTAEISVSALNALHDAGIDLAAVVTQPDRTRGRNRSKLIPPAIKLRSLELGIDVLQPKSAKDPEFLDELESLKAEAFAVFSFGQILPKRLLEMPDKGCFNAHASLLPRWRGASPINHAILSGDEKTGMTIQRMVPKLDAGAVCWQRELVIGERETAPELAIRLMELAGEGLIAVLEKAATGTLDCIEQDESQATYASLLGKCDGAIDWKLSARQIDRTIRAMQPWPGTYFACEGESIKIHRAEPIALEHGRAPGTLLKSDAEGLLVACGDGALRIEELQRSGKKRLCAQAYICGCCPAVGSLFENGVK